MLRLRQEHAGQLSLVGQRAPECYGVRRVLRTVRQAGLALGRGRALTRAPSKSAAYQGDRLQTGRGCGWRLKGFLGAGG